MAQLEILRHLGAAQVEVAVGQAQVFISDLGIKRERRHVGFVEHFQLRRDEFDFARDELRIDGSLDARANAAGDLDHVFAAQLVREFGDLRIFLGAEDDLRDPFAVAQINENNAAVVAAGVNPARQGDGLADVFFAEDVAEVGAIHGD